MVDRELTTLLFFFLFLKSHYLIFSSFLFSLVIGYHHNPVWEENNFLTKKTNMTLATVSPSSNESSLVVRELEKQADQIYNLVVQNIKTRGESEKDCLEETDKVLRSLSERILFACLISRHNRHTFSSFLKGFIIKGQTGDIAARAHAVCGIKSKVAHFFTPTRL